MTATEIEERVHRLEREVSELRRSIERRDTAPASRAEFSPEDRRLASALFRKLLDETGYDSSSPPMSAKELREAMLASGIGESDEFSRAIIAMREE